MPYTIPETHTVTDGAWTFTRDGWGATYTAANADTGETFDTGETSMSEVHRVMFERSQAARAAARAAAEQAGESVPVYEVQRGRVSTARPSARRPE